MRVVKQLSSDCVFIAALLSLASSAIIDNTLMASNCNYGDDVNSDSNYGDDMNYLLSVGVLSDLKWSPNL